MDSRLATTGLPVLHFTHSLYGLAHNRALAICSAAVCCLIDVPTNEAHMCEAVNVVAFSGGPLSLAVDV